MPNHAEPPGGHVIRGQLNPNSDLPREVQTDQHHNARHALVALHTSFRGHWTGDATGCDTIGWFVAGREVELRHCSPCFGLASGPHSKTNECDVASSTAFPAPSHTRVHMRRLLTAITLCAALACGGDSSTSPASASIAGSYTMRTINGSNLPFTIAVGGQSLTILSDVLVLTDGGTWSETGTYRQNGQTQTASDGGTIVRAGTAITLVSSGSPSYSGTVNGNTLNLTDQTLGATVVFSK